MTTRKNQQIMGGAVALMCALRLADVAEVWQGGHALIAALIVVAALVGTALGVTNVLRARKSAPAATGQPEAPDPAGKDGAWNALLNGGFFCYFVATIAISLVKPWGLRSLSGIVGVLGVVATVFYAVRAYNRRRRAASAR